MIDAGIKSLRLIILVLVGFLAHVSASFAGTRGLPAQQGIPNFGKVAEGVFRGAEPDTAAVNNLQRLGIKTIIDLRMQGHVRKAESAEARASGIVYTNVPMPGLSRPTDAQVRKVLELMDSLPKPIFIHCQHGCDRTGTVIACYRIKHDHWKLGTAWQEAVHYGISWLERGMKNYVKDFARTSTTLAKN